MNLIHTNLGTLANVAESRENTRYAVTGVNLRFLPDGRYCADATDTKILMRVEGPVVAPSDEYPEIPAMRDAPDSAQGGLVPSKAWKEKMAQAQKLTKRNTKPTLQSVAVKFGANEVTMGCTNLESSPVDLMRLVEGRFPPVDAFIPKPGRLKELFSFDSTMMVRLLEAFKGIAGNLDTGGAQVSMSMTADADRIVLQSVNKETQQTVYGLLVPMVGNPPIASASERESKPAEATSAIVLAELDAARARIASLEGDIAERVERFDLIYFENETLRKEKRDMAKTACDKIGDLETALRTAQASVLDDADREALRKYEFAFASVGMEFDLDSVILPEDGAEMEDYSDDTVLEDAKVLIVA